MFNLSIQYPSKILISQLIVIHFFCCLLYEFGNIFFETNLTRQGRTMRLYFDHSWAVPVNGKRLEKQENDLSEVRYPSFQEQAHCNPK